MEDVLLSILTDLLMVIATVGAGFLVAFLKKKLGVEKLRKLQQESEFIKEVVKAGVQYAEQRFSTGEKLDEAVNWITSTLNAKGFIVTTQEVEGLIEATIRQFKDEFGENWGREVETTK